MTIFEKELMDPQYDNDYHSRMLSLSREEKYDSYYKTLEFGTAGMRGKMGVGPNRMHIYQIRRVSAAFGNYLLSEREDASCVIAFDSRNSSLEFSREAAVTLASMGIKVYLFRDYSSTPELSFAVRSLRASGGVVITASHNPPEYNGYKVYHYSGRQLLDEEAAKVLDFFENLPSKITNSSYSQLIEEGKIEFVSLEVLDEYDKTLLSGIKKESQAELRVVYSALHGVAGRGTKALLSKMGVEFIPVESQFEPDGTFPEAKYPNPEEPSVFEKALELGREKQADLLLASDPDGDRLGAMVYHEGEYVSLSGNEIGLLMAGYLMAQSRGEVITSIVSGYLLEDMARDLGSKVTRTLTGFKYIGERMNQIFDFLLGYEESYGYLSLDHARDKDAIQAAGRLCEMAKVYKEEGKTLIDVLNEIYEKYGYEKNKQIVFTLEGAEGAEKIKELMDGFRMDPLVSLDGRELIKSTDYLNDETGYPKSNVLMNFYEGGHWLAFRPSGTEPKLKIYLGLRGQDREELEEVYERVRLQLESLATI
ncbi:MAG: phospho-sugar mutase [Tissierellia bacterium]|nr:phospho-sugar mutase [Tissierellia bacterium]